MVNLPISRLRSIILCLVLVFLRAEADSVGGANFPTMQDQTYQPSLAVVVGILGIMFVITMVLILYTKCFGPSGSPNGNQGQNGAGILGMSKRFSGLDKTVIESLPFFKFSSLKGSKEGLECAVCLSKFEDVEVLRLLPKCKHAFHIDCIDHWLEKHSSCPLCRRRVSLEDLKLVMYSNSLRFLREESSDVELFVQREDSHRGSSRFSVGNSFRMIEKRGGKDLIWNEAEADQQALHKLNHKIVVSDFVFNNRWSDLRSSDLAVLNSEMLNDASSGRFSAVETSNNASSTKKAVHNVEIMKIKEEIEIKKMFENKVGVISTTQVSNPITFSESTSRSITVCGEQRSLSDISVFTRNANSDLRSMTTSSSPISEGTEKEDRVRKVWLPIANRTMQWFANKERSQHSQSRQRQSIDV